VVWAYASVAYRPFIERHGALRVNVMRALYAAIGAATLLGRMGRMREVANLLAFLASDYNTFMTGNEIIIDGGRIISRRPDPEEITAGVL